MDGVSSKVRRVVVVLLHSTATVLLLVSWGVVGGWPNTVVEVSAAVGAALLLLMIAARAGCDFGRRWPTYGTAALAVAVVAVAVACAVTVVGRWVGLPERDACDVAAVADEASAVARLLTTVPDRGRSRYLQQLRPHVIDEVYDALATDVVG